MNAITFGAWKDIKMLTASSSGTTSTPRETTGVSRKERDIMSMQGGGITLSEGIYHLHDKEIVAPLDPFTKEQSAQKALLGTILSELINQSAIQRKALKEKEFRHAFEG